MSCARFRIFIALVFASGVVVLSAQAQTTNLIFGQTNQVWKYQEIENLDSINWQASGFDDSAWPSGAALLAFESNAGIVALRNTVLGDPRLAGNPPAGHARYFRTHFNWSGSSLGATLTFRARLDDGALIYLNGAEIIRIRPPAEPITHATVGAPLSASGDADTDDVFSIVITNASQLVQGDNVLAVAVYQNATTSSDVVWGTSLSSTAPQFPTITDPTQPSNRVVIATRTTTLSVSVSAAPAPSFQWLKDSNPILDATNNTYVIASMTAGDAGNYHCVIQNPVGSVTSRVAVVQYSTDNAPPQVSSVSGSVNLSTVIVRFNEAVEVNSGEDEFNYQLPGFTITAAALQPGGQAVVLALDSPLSLDTAYQLTVDAILDLSGNAMGPTNVNFRSFAIVQGFAAQELYFGIPGNSVAELTSAPSYPNSPGNFRYVTSLDGPTNSFEMYGTRISGYLVPPVSGAYNFFISSDDGGEFWLSTDATPASRYLVCSEPQWNGVRDWNGIGARRNGTTPENRSSTLFPQGITLTAGELYYFEMLHKEGGGGDNSGVTWQLPGAPVPPNGSPSIPGANMATLADITGALLNVTQPPVDQLFAVTSTVLRDETFDAGGGGFVATASPVTTEGPWVYDAATGSWGEIGQQTENSVPNTVRLTSPTLTVTSSGRATLTFGHRYSFEYDGTRWDGGQVRISVNGAAFTTVPDSAFVQNGYGGFVIEATSNAELKGQPAFTGDSVGSGFVTSVVDLGHLNAGDTVAIQFVASGDTNTRGLITPNWQIDSFRLTQGSQPPATFSVGISASRPGEPSPPVSYQWQKDTGTGFAPVPGANSGAYSFVPTLADDGARFRVQVYIPGATQTSASALLTVVTAEPRLAIVQSNNTVLVSWPASLTGFVLEAAPAIVSPSSAIAWSTAGIPSPVVANGRSTVSLPTDMSFRTFRLRR